MSERSEADRAGRQWAATGLWLTSVTLGAAGTVEALHHAALLRGGDGLALIIAAASLATAGIGAVVAGKTGNPIGWLLAGGGLALSAGLAAMVPVATACGPGRPAATWLVAVAVAGPALWWVCLATSIALFPSGRLGRGRGTAMSMAGPVLAMTGAALGVVGALARPVAVARALGFGTCALATGSATASRAEVAGLTLLGAGYAITAGWALRRVLRLEGEERARLLPVAVVTAVGLVWVAAATLDPHTRPFSGDRPWVLAAWVAVGLGIPIAVTVSVIRERTFGIYRLMGYLADYRLWTAGSAAVAVAAATGIGWGVTALIGLSRQPIAVALATLAAAAALFPFWRRRQIVVDARFGQSWGDPVSALEALADAHGGTTGPLRGRVFDLLGRFAPVVVVEGESGMRFAVRTDDREIGRHTFVHGAYDLDTMTCAMQLLEAELGRGHAPLAGRTVLDVGANIGTSIVPLLALYGADRGVAVEPAPENVEMLRLNLALNGLTERVWVLPVALSDHDGELELALSAENFGDHRIRGPGIAPADETSSRPTITVPVRRLDSLIEKGELDASSIGLIWLDVQGHEGHVLAGARALLASRIPVISEFWPSTMERAGGLDSFRNVVRSCFTRVVDVRRVQAEGRSETLPSSRIDELVERYAGSAAFTDLLLIP